jgi:ferredoxin-type protein NapG
MKMNRRDFLKSLPRQLVEGLRAVTLENTLTESARSAEQQVAHVDITRCLAWSGANCQLCYLACPRRETAIQMQDQKPVIIASSCDGCALCQQACQTVNDLIAIEIVRKNH